MESLAQTERLDVPDLSSAHLQTVRLQGADLSGARLALTYFGDADLAGADLSGADLSQAYLRNASLQHATLEHTTLIEVELGGADLSHARMAGADLRSAHLRGANLTDTDLRRASLIRADLREAIAVGTDLEDADLTESQVYGIAAWNVADLREAIAVGTDLEDADLTESQVYGIAAWNVELRGAIQRDLLITPEREHTITTDNLAIAQFLYLLLQNERIRDVIETVGRKAVLILGRFTVERKAVLDAIRNVLREHNLVPILFDFEGPRNRDLTESRVLRSTSRRDCGSSRTSRSWALSPSMNLRAAMSRSIGNMFG